MPNLNENSMQNKIIISITSWPPRYQTAHMVFQNIIRQAKAAKLMNRIHIVLVLSEEEACDVRFRQDACDLIRRMEKLNVEVIYDKGNIRSHKKLIPTIEKYPDNPILVVDDDVIQPDGWLQTFVRDHDAHTEDIIYGQSNGNISVVDGRIVEQTMRNTHPGEITVNAKPANGAAGTLYPAHTFTDPRFFDRDLMMQLSPSSDETWQWAFAKIEGRTYRCLSSHNYPYCFGANQTYALCKENKDRYTEIHNRIADAIPEYMDSFSVYI